MGAEVGSCVGDENKFKREKTILSKKNKNHFCVVISQKHTRIESLVSLDPPNSIVKKLRDLQLPYAH